MKFSGFLGEIGIYPAQLSLLSFLFFLLLTVLILDFVFDFLLLHKFFIQFSMCISLTFA